MIRVLACVLATVWMSFAAAAEARFALLVGNEDYPAEVGVLQNPHEDVSRVATALSQAGFSDVEVLKDANQQEINLAVARLTRKLREAGDQGVGFFYYSGHGGSTESSGVRRNYVLPAKTLITGAEELPILGVAIDSVVDSLVATNAKAVFVISDACRNTLPITSSKGGSSDKSFVPTQTRSGLYVAYSTADGATARDDGIFSEALAAQIVKPDQYVSRAFTLALREVARRRPGNKLPFSVDGLTEDLCFLSCPGSSSRGKSDDERDWERLSALDKAEGYRIYLALHPVGTYVSSARSALDRLAGSTIVGGSKSGTPGTDEYIAAANGSVAEGTVDFDRLAPGVVAAYEAGDSAYFAQDYLEASRQYKVACDGGDPRGCADLGYLYDSGLGVAQSDAIAFGYYDKGCDGNQAFACANTGVFYESGRSVAKDHARAFGLYQKGCDLEEYYCTYVGYMYRYSKGVAQDYGRARQLYSTSCDADDARGCFELASMTQWGEGAEPDLLNARPLYDKACVLDASRCADIGVFYENGWGGPVDHAKAFEAYEQACATDDTRCTYLAYMYDHGRGVSPDDATARTYYERGCNAGDGRGCYSIGLLYEYGDGGPMDLGEAVRHYDLACQLEDEHCTYIGYMYEHGRGVGIDVNKARGFYERACDGDDARACAAMGYMKDDGIAGAKDAVGAAAYYEKACGLDDAYCVDYGVMYENGRGVPRDESKAAELYGRSCEADDKHCTYSGYMYYWAKGVGQDHYRARLLYKRGCEANDDRGCYSLGQMHYDGEGGAKDTAQGLTYIRRACSNKYEDACTWISERGL